MESTVLKPILLEKMNVSLYNKSDIWGIAPFGEQIKGDVYEKEEPLSIDVYVVNEVSPPPLEFE